MKWNLKIKAGSLQFVLFIGVVILLLLLTFVTLSHTQNLFGKKTQLLVQTVKMADFGLGQALKSDLIPNDSTLLNLNLATQVKIKAVKEYWGVYEKYTTVATFKKNRFVKSVLVGHNTLDPLPALYLEDNQRPMIIVGKAKITGDAYLPKQGIRPGNISGNSFYNTSLINGRTLNSSSNLPKLTSSIKEHILSFSRSNFPNNENTVQLKSNLKLQNSFKNPTKGIHGNVIHLSGVSLMGNIVVRASQRIVVEASSQLQDVILVAPEIIIKNKVVGTFQSFATKQITVGKNCILGYPSALVVNDFFISKNEQNVVPYTNINIGDNTSFKGIVMYLKNAETKPQYLPQIKINENTILHGEIYCEQNLELKGEVWGSVNTKAFIAIENGSIYQNHLYNGKINSELIPKQYVGVMLEGNKRKKAISKWLY